MREMIERTHKTYERLDILHNHVGGSDHTRDVEAANITNEAWNDIFTWNMNTTRWGCQYALPLMVADGGGSIHQHLVCRRGLCWWRT